MKRTSKFLGMMLVLSLLMILATTTVFATNLSNTVYTSNLIQSDDIVLTGNTTIFVNADLTLKSISGDYTLEIQGDGEHTLTVNNPNGCAINVKTLRSVKPSQGTVNLTVKGGNSKYAIYTQEDIALNGINLNVSGGAGIRSYEGDININGTYTSVVGQNGVAIIANNGSISIDSDYLFVQCAGQSGEAQWEHGIGATKDVTIISEDATITGKWGVFSQTGNVSLQGTIDVGATKTAIEAEEGTITMTGSVTAQGGDSNYAIYAEGNISFNGTNFDVNGGAGIRSYEGDININGTQVSVVGQDGIGVIANSGSIRIDSDYLFVQCEGQSGEAEWEHGIGAFGDITINSADATITGLRGVYSQAGNITLSGNIDVGATESAIYSKDGTITMTGAVTAQSGDGYYVIAASGDISFDGTKLDVKGSSGIRSAEGDITINGTHTSVVGQDGVGIIANSGSIYIDSDYLFVQCAGQSGDAEWEHGVGATNDVTIISDDATITGRWGVYSETGSVTLWGNTWVGARKAAIRAEKNVLVYGDLSANNIDQDYFCIVSADGDITLSNGTINIASTSNAVITHNGNIYLKGNITVKSSGAGSCAINAREGDIVIQEGSLDVTAGGNYAMYAYNGQIGMNQPLAILTPANGCIDSNTIVDTNGNPASHVEIATIINDVVSISINAPVAGEKPVSSTKNVYGLPAHTTAKSVEWFVSDIPHGNNEPFIVGQNYKVKIVLKADEGYRFVSGNIAKLNGKDATTGWNDGGKELIITYTFSDCPAAIKNVALTVVAPYDGNSISYSVTDESAGYSVGNNSNYVSWYVSDDGANYTLMDSGSKFVGGKYYKVDVVVMTHTGYEFALKDAGSIQPNVNATINGFKATVTKGIEQDPSKEITVTYAFGLCNDRIIEEINIVDVPIPVPGEKPVYIVAAYGTGYSITNKNTSREVYEGGQYVDKYYIRNGIGWYDVTADDWIYETDSFVAGHDYQCVVYVQTDTDYEFVQDLYANPEIWPSGTVNGNEASILKEGSGLIWNQQVRYTFGWTPVTVTGITIADLDAPIVGGHPDVIVSLGENCDLLYDATVTWYEYLGNDQYGAAVMEDEVFLPETPYRAEIVIRPKKTPQNTDICNFNVNEQSVYVNGEYPDDMMSNSKSVYIYYTVKHSASAPVIGASVSGFVQAYDSSEVPVIKLYAIDDSDYLYPLYIANIGNSVVDGNMYCWKFDVEAVQSGTYNIVFEKDNHRVLKRQIDVYDTDINLGFVTMEPKVSFAWNGDNCTIELDSLEDGVIIRAASYVESRMEGIVVFDAETMSATLTGDTVKVFYWKENLSPVRQVIVSTKP